MKKIVKQMIPLVLIGIVFIVSFCHFHEDRTLKIKHVYISDFNYRFVAPEVINEENELKRLMALYESKPNGKKVIDYFESIDFDFDFEENTYVRVSSGPVIRLHCSLKNTFMHDQSPDYCKAMRTCDYLLEIEYENGLKFENYRYNMDIDAINGPIYIYVIDKIENLKTEDGL